MQAMLYASTAADFNSVITQVWRQCELYVFKRTKQQWSNHVFCPI